MRYIEQYSVTRMHERHEAFLDLWIQYEAQGVKASKDRAAEALGVSLMSVHGRMGGSTAFRQRVHDTEALALRLRRAPQAERDDILFADVRRLLAGL